jgi:hypothetical protein
MTGVASAAAPDGRLFEPAAPGSNATTPTLISSRYFSEFIFESFDGDGDVYKNENTLRWGIPWRDGHAFGIQAMLPVKWREVAGDEPSVSVTSNSAPASAAASRPPCATASPSMRCSTPPPTRCSATAPSCCARSPPCAGIGTRTSRSASTSNTTSPRSMRTPMTSARSK